MFEPSFVEPNLHRLDEQTAELLIVCVWEDVRPLRGPAGLCLLYTSDAADE